MWQAHVREARIQGLHLSSVMLCDSDSGMQSQERGLFRVELRTVLKKKCQVGVQRIVAPIKYCFTF